jgi:hypothetical protein
MVSMTDQIVTPAAGDPDRTARAGSNRMTRAIGVLMIVATASFTLASIIHFGVRIPLGVTTVHDPFAGAKVPEAIIAAALATGTVFYLTRTPAARPVALITTAFAFLGTVVGLHFTLGSGRTADLTYHFTVLTLLAAILILLAFNRRPRVRA